jgi:thiamine pyrophosphokinase
MAATIIIKNSVTTGDKPTTSDLVQGELAVNLIDKRLYSRDNSNNIVQVGGIGATGGGVDDVFYENAQTVTTSYTISTGKSAMSTGPITINTGITVTIPDGCRWVIL